MKLNINWEAKNTIIYGYLLVVFICLLYLGYNVNFVYTSFSKTVSEIQEVLDLKTKVAIEVIDIKSYNSIKARSVRHASYVLPKYRNPYIYSTQSYENILPVATSSKQLTASSSLNSQLPAPAKASSTMNMQ